MTGMTKLSRIIRTGLGHNVAARTDHPDANLLAALAENSLSGHERKAVLNHVAECADCRECLALSAKIAISNKERIPAARPLWRKTRVAPSWPWMGAAVTVMVVMSMVWEWRFLERRTPVVTEKKQTVKTPPEIAGETPAVTTSHEKSELPTRRMSEAIKHTKTRRSHTLTGTHEAGIEAEAHARSADEMIAAPQAKATAGSAPAFVPQPKVASRLQTDQAFRQMSGYNAFKKNANAAAAMSAISPVSSALWSINESPNTVDDSRGVVERSIDNGRSWEIVPVSNQVDFRAVAANESDIWAGGSQGALFHSSDGGRHWTQVPVRVGASELDGTIISIDVHNWPEIAIATSSGEKWVSDDKGAHWRPE